MENGRSRERLFVDSALARRLELAEAEGGASCGCALAREKPESGACVETIAGGRAVFTEVGSPITQATGIGLDGVVTAEEFSRLENFFFGRGVAVNVETSPVCGRIFIFPLREKWILRDGIYQRAGAESGGARSRFKKSE